MGRWYVCILTQYDITLDQTANGLAFKQAIAEATHVPPERQKVMIKGGLLKDDTALGQIGARAGQTFMVIGAVGELPKAPAKPIQFLEDLPDEDLSQAQSWRGGLVNLGNTCYLNSTLQVLRSMEPLQEALAAYTPRVGASEGDASLVAALRDLYRDMGKTTEAVPPLVFLSILRKLAPQFAEMAEGGGYAQQDAEEAWIRIVQALSILPSPAAPSDRFVPQFLNGSMAIERRCLESADEVPATLQEPFQMLQCNISSTTNTMESGIEDALTQHLEKYSDTLQREAQYEEKRRIARLPAFLPVHFVRFYWRRDIQKKTKIMRKVKFPKEWDAHGLATPELAERIAPVRNKMREIAKARDERAKVRARAKGRPDEAAAVEGGALTDEQEKAQRAQEAAELDAIVDAGLRSDLGCNVSGLYELVGIVTHKGAAADGGHYMSWVRKEPRADDVLAPPSTEWYKFNDDQVSVVPADKLDSLSGGGEDSVAYLLLYRAKTL